MTEKEKGSLPPGEPTGLLAWKSRQEEADIVITAASPLRASRVRPVSLLAGRDPAFGALRHAPDLHSMPENLALDALLTNFTNVVELAHYKYHIIGEEHKDAVDMMIMAAIEYRGGQFLRNEAPERSILSYQRHKEELHMLTEHVPMEKRYEYFKAALDPLFAAVLLADNHLIREPDIDNKAIVQMSYLYESMWKGGEVVDPKRPPLHQRFVNTLEKHRHDLLPEIDFVQKNLSRGR